MHWEEVVWLPCYAELQAATLVFGIYHWQAPLEEIPPAVVAILTINLPNHWGADTRPRAGNKKLQQLASTELTKRLSSPSAWPDLQTREGKELMGSRMALVSTAWTRSVTYGKGMVMITSFSSRLSSCNSYSMLTSQLFPLSDGQQLTEGTETLC